MPVFGEAHRPVPCADGTYRSRYTHRRLKIFTDEPDNCILECAEVGAADCTVTPDKAMLKLGFYENVRIISLRQYLNSL